MEIVKNTTFAELAEAFHMPDLEDVLMSDSKGTNCETSGVRSILELVQQNAEWGWSMQDTMKGILRMQTIVDQGVEMVYPLYSKEEIAADPALAQAKLIYLPAEEQKTDYYAVLFSGGGYNRVCNAGEGFPVAARLNELGVTTFLVNYRTRTDETEANGLMPKPMDDVAKAMKMIAAKAKDFGVEGLSYVAGGFSAGGNLAAIWGTKNHGARSYDLPQAKALLLVYPLVTLANMDEAHSAVRCVPMYGPGDAAAKIREYSAIDQMDSGYPLVYITKAADDPVIPAQDAQQLKAAMDAAGIPCEVECGPNGGHGFGLGTECSQKGWVDRAVAWIAEKK